MLKNVMDMDEQHKDFQAKAALAGRTDRDHGTQLIFAGRNPAVEVRASGMGVCPVVYEYLGAAFHFLVKYRFHRTIRFYPGQYRGSQL